MSEDAELLMAEIDRWTSKPARRPGDITAQEYAAHAGMLTSTAENVLRRLVADGKLETEMAWSETIRRMVRVYRRKVE